MTGAPRDGGPSPAELLEDFLAASAGPGEPGADAAGLCSRLDAWGLHRHYVPREHGGELAGFPQLQDLLRTVARRDLPAAVAHGGTFLGAVCAWVAGDRRATGPLAEQVLSGRPVSLGLAPEGAARTPRAAGPGAREPGPDGGGRARWPGGGPGDPAPDGPGLAAEDFCGSGAPGGAELTARRTPRGYRLDGEQWLVGSAARGGGVLCLFARTSPGGGPRGYSLLLADPGALAPGSFRRLPAVPTLGVRGARMTGVAFDGAEVPADAMIGGEGEAAEIVLKALQAARVVVPAFSLGAADHGLRLALRGTREERSFGAPRGRSPAHRVLGESYADLLAMEALGAVAARGVHLLPGEQSVTAAAVRYLVPAVVEDVLARLREVLDPGRDPGGRHRTGGPASRGRGPAPPGLSRLMFDKVERDHRLVNALEGDPAMHLYGIAAQFRSLAAHHATASEHPPPDALFDLPAPPPPARLDALRLATRGSRLLASLPESARALRRAAEADPRLDGAARQAGRLAAAAAELHRTLPVEPRTAALTSPDTYDAARRYSLLLAAAACLGVWRHCAAVDERWPDALWLHAALTRLRTRLRPGNRPFLAVAGPWGAGCDDEVFERMAQQLAAHHRSGESLSLLAFRTAEGASC